MFNQRLKMDLKTLIIITGSARGGEDTWETMYENLQKPFNADIAICFGDKENKTISLYKKAKYVWEINEYDNWKDYYSNKFEDGWIKIFENNAKNGLMGGIDNQIGSGAIVFAFRDFVLKNFKEIIIKYDRIIYTRSDHYYINQHPILPNDKFYIVEGEDYDGLCDRHYVFNSNMVEKVLGICDFICNTKNYELFKDMTNLNPEKTNKLFFEFNGIINDIERIKRVQFTVATNTDTTRWMKANNVLPENSKLKIKYIPEYNLAKQ